MGTVETVAAKELERIVIAEIPKAWRIDAHYASGDIDHVLIATPPEGKHRIVVDLYFETAGIFIYAESWMDCSGPYGDVSPYNDLSSWETDEDGISVEYALADPKCFEKVRSTIKKYVQHAQL